MKVMAGARKHRARPECYHVQWGTRFNGNGITILIHGRRDSLTLVPPGRHNRETFKNTSTAANRAGAVPSLTVSRASTCRRRAIEGRHHRAR